MREPFQTLISAAVLAPSGDNTQPWKFEIDEPSSTITVCLDPTRDTSPMNAGQRMARIACGAAIENIVQTAEYNGWSTKVQSLNESDSDALARIVVDACGNSPGAVEPAILQRCTNRYPYDRRPLPASVLAELARSCPGDDGLQVEWVTDRDQIESCARIIAASDAAMFGDREFLLAFLSNVRFDLPTNEPADEGLPIGALGLAWHERLLLPWLASLLDWRIARPVLKCSFYAKAKRLAKSSSGVCLVMSQASGVNSDLNVGRTMQHIWLALTRLGLVAQPMMSLPVLRGFDEYSAGAEGNEVSVGAVLSSAGAATNDGALLARAIFRFGTAQQSAQVHTSRRSVREVATRNKESRQC